MKDGPAAGAPVRSDPGLLRLERPDLLRADAFIGGAWRGSASGYGREGSRHGLADDQNLKYVCLGGLEAN